MRYRYLKRIIFFLIFLSVVCILSVSKWNSRGDSLDDEIFSGVSVHKIFGAEKRDDEKTTRGSTDTRVNDVDYMLFIGSAKQKYETSVDHQNEDGTQQVEDTDVFSKVKSEGAPDNQVDPGQQGSDLGSSPSSGASGVKTNQNAPDATAVVSTETTSPNSSIPKKRRKKLKPLGHYPGYVNVHIWEEWCGYRVLDLRRNKHFPLYPDIRQKATRLYVRHGESQFGQRIFGYIHPPGTGNYIFAVSSDDSSEVWLSVSDDPELIQRIAWVGDTHAIANTLLGQFNKYKGQMSNSVYLQKNSKYYIEILHKQHAYKDHVLVAWKGPGVPVFKAIGSRYLSAYLGDEEIGNDVNELADFIPETIASFPTHLHGTEAKLYTFNRTQYGFGGADSRDDFHKVPLVDEQEMGNLFPKCKYRPSYIVDFKVRRYEGVSLIHETAIYPNDLTELTHMYSDCDMREIDSHGNDLSSNGREESSSGPDTETTDSSSVFSKLNHMLSGVKKGIMTYMAKLYSSPPVVEEAASDFVQGNISSTIGTVSPVSTTDSGKYLKVGHKFVNSYFLRRKNRNTRASNALKLLRKRIQQSLEKSQNPRLRKLMYISRDTIDNSNDVENEGLPNSYNRRQLYRPIFVPIEGVENESLSFRTFTSMPMSRDIGAGRKRGNAEYIVSIAPFTRNRTVGKIYFNPEVFKLKSPKEVMKYYRIFKGSLYSMMRELPRPDTWKYRQHRSECRSDGNLLLNEKVATSIVTKVMRGIQSKNKNKYALKKVINVEENHDVIKGDRYLVELDLKKEGHGEQSIRFSRYFYQPIGKLDLCEPEGLQWDPHSTVHVIVPVKNQGRWVQHFIDNMEKIYLETLDQHLNIIIVDFNSSDIDVDASLKRSKLRRYKVIHLDGPFQRALGIQAGADLVHNPHDIIFTCDLHLEIPSQLIDSIRKHCIEGRMAFAPVVVRLECGYTPDLPYGLWEIQGYGLFAVCKSDFDRIGGMNTKEFKTKWGGEDWEMLDRVLSHGIEVERLRIPKFYHYHHSKKRMWVNRVVEN